MQKFSLSTAKLGLLRDGNARRSASSFFYSGGQQLFLITNWHVLTGVHPQTLKALDKTTGFIPDAIRIHWKQYVQVGEATAVRTQSVDLPLYDGASRPLWFEHATRQSVDIAALLLDRGRFSNCANIAINEIEQEERLTVEAGEDCLILGFPEGLQGPAVTPIWNRGIRSD
jgi:hypothetical protein